MFHKFSGTPVSLRLAVNSGIISLVTKIVLSSVQPKFAKGKWQHPVHKLDDSG